MAEGEGPKPVQPAKPDSGLHQRPGDPGMFTQTGWRWGPEEQQAGKDTLAKRWDNIKAEPGDTAKGGEGSNIQPDQPKASTEEGLPGNAPNENPSGK